MEERRDFLLTYDPDRWRELPTKPVNTLQVFVTNRCNLRCRGCFYAHALNRTEMGLAAYVDHLEQYASQVDKVILLGGEPLLHDGLGSLLAENARRGLRTTIYTNGRNLDRLAGLPRDGVELRIGVYGAASSEKPLAKVGDTDWPVKVVYMLRHDNVDELTEVAAQAEDRFDCRGLYVSSIRDIAVTGDYWRDTPETISPREFAAIAQHFVEHYDGGLPRLDLATRGVLVTATQNFRGTRHCRFGNVFPDGGKIICPFDISRRLMSPELSFGERPCTKHDRCLLQKIVLVRP
jgi:hypothetical protein